MASQQLTLPTNLEAERVLLGALLSDPGAVGAISESLPEAAFSLEKHRKIYRCILHLHEFRKPIDILTVADELTLRGELESCDGIGYLVSLGDGVPKVLNLGSYANIVSEKSHLRQIITVATRAARDAAKQHARPQEIINSLMGQLDTLVPPDIDGPLSPGQFVEAHEGGLTELLSPRSGLPTGFHKLDEMLDGGGLQPETMTVIGAESSRGKSAYAANIAMNVAKRGAPVAFYSLEMSRRSLFHRAICCEGEVSLWKFKHNYLSEQERLQLMRASSKVSEMPIYWDCRSGLSLSQLRRRLSRLHREREIKLAIIDYLQIMDWDEGGVKEMRHGFVRITKGVKELARDLRIPILLLSQLRRDPSRRTSKDPRPRLSDLRETSSIENDADAVLLIYRPEFDNPANQDLKGMAELIVAKQRDGPTGIIHMRFEGQFLRFREQEPASPATPPATDHKAAASGGDDK